MTPSQFHGNHHIKREINPNVMYPSHSLKINKDSRFIKKSSSSPSSSSIASSSASSVIAATTAAKPPHRQPVIIYTHSPKVIHTNSNDFMALVQKLTGLSRPDENPNPNPRPKKEPSGVDHSPEDLNKNIQKAANSDESESSGITEDYCPSAVVENVHINSCFPPPIFDSNLNPCFNNIPMFTPNDLLSSAHPFYNNYTDPMLFMPNMRSSTSSSTNLEAMKEFREF